MDSKDTIMENIRSLWSHLRPVRKTQLYFLAAAMIVMSFLEIMTLASVLPFLGALTVPETVFNHPMFQPLLHILDVSSPDSLILPITVIFCAAALIAGVWRLAILFVSTRFAYAVGADFGYKIFSKYLALSYGEHMSNNSSDLLSVITLKINHVVNAVIFQLLALMVSLAICIAIILALITVSPGITFVATVGFGVIYVLVFLFQRRKVLTQSIVIADNSVSIMSVVAEAVGNIKEVILYGMRAAHTDKFKRFDVPMRRAQAYHQFIGQAPRYAIEALGMIVIAVIAYQQVAFTEGGLAMLAVLGTFALGAQRLLPAGQQIFAAITSINGSKASMEDVLHFLNLNVPEHDTGRLEPLPFKKSMRLKNVTFSHDGQKKPILNNISLTIRHGECLGILGETGSGKSTLLAMIMGLIDVSSGKIEIDGRVCKGENVVRWRHNVCHVPQGVFLFDGTITENITLQADASKIDRIRLEAAIDVAQLRSTLSGLSEGLETIVGERGGRVSGGELQRIGIARALYRDRDILVLDEATSALDQDTEALIMRKITSSSSNKTTIIVAHRLNSLKDCDRLALLRDGELLIVESGTEEFNKLIVN